MSLHSRAATSVQHPAKKPFVWLVAAAVVWLLAACATPSARIKRNQEVFDQLAPAEQALIREGKVAIGFTQDMVRLAVGDPDQRWTRTDAAGRSELWTYSTYDTNLGAPLYRGYYHRSLGGYPIYGDALYSANARAREVFKVTFVDGKVSEITQLQR
ncbi:MAG: hypothetical protein MUE42_04045 [Opitutaceae bacterium]|jgi:hypothetical protein|nr:hypothetical protein [Opitutaceae bacterium]